MKNMILPFLFLVAVQGASQDTFQLAPPLLIHESIFFIDQTTLGIKFNQPETEIRYTTNGKEPTEKDLLYTHPIVIKDMYTVIKARTFGKKYYSSETVLIEFYKKGKTIKHISYTSPNPRYPGNGETILTDLKGGLKDFTAATSLGYDKDSVELIIELTKEEKINSILFDFLQQENSWVFLPEEIQLYYYNQKKNSYVPFGNKRLNSETPSPDKCTAIKIGGKKAIQTKKIKAILWPLKKNPDWHPGKGNHAWLFIDEVMVY